MREGLAGCLLVNMESGEVASYDDLRSNLEAHAWAREESESGLVRGGAGATRTHYRAVLSFERDMPSAAILAMAKEWLNDALPTARAAVFIHRNTDHVHAHVWIDARGTDGKKLDLSPRRYRSLGSRWDRVYARETALRERLGVSREGPEGEKGRIGGGGKGAGGRADEDQKARRRTTPGERALEACAHSRERAVRAAEELRRELESLDRGRAVRGFGDEGERAR